MYHCVYLKSGCYEGTVSVFLVTCVGFDLWGWPWEIVYLFIRAKLSRHHVVGFVLGILVPSRVLGGCLGGKYWFLVVLQFPFVEHK